MKKLLFTVLGIIAFVICVSAQTMVYPQAEWSRAGDILMHTPGHELFVCCSLDELIEALK